MIRPFILLLFTTSVAFAQTYKWLVPCEYQRCTFVDDLDGDFLIFEDEERNVGVYDITRDSISIPMNSIAHTSWRKKITFDKWSGISFEQENKQIAYSLSGIKLEDINQYDISYNDGLLSFLTYYTSEKTLVLKDKNNATGTVIKGVTAMGRYSEGLLPVVFNDSIVKILDRTGKEIATVGNFSYVKFKPFYNGICAMYNREDQVWFINKKGEIIKQVSANKPILSWEASKKYGSVCYQLSYGGKKGLFFNEKLIIPLKYKSIKHVSPKLFLAYVDDYKFDVFNYYGSKITSDADRFVSCSDSLELFTILQSHKHKLIDYGGNIKLTSENQLSVLGNSHIMIDNYYEIQVLDLNLEEKFKVKGLFFTYFNENTFFTLISVVILNHQK